MRNEVGESPILNRKAEGRRHGTGQKTEQKRTKGYIAMPGCLLGLTTLAWQLASVGSLPNSSRPARSRLGC